MDQDSERGIIQPESLDNPFQIQYFRRPIDVYPVIDHELDQFESGYSSLDMSMFTLTAGALLGIAVAWLTTQPSGPSLYMLVALSVGLIPTTAYFGYRARISRREMRRLSTKIRTRSGLPL